MIKDRLIIATRKSELALFQAEWVKNALLKHHPYLTIDILGLVTTADKITNVTLNQIGGKGLFVKELEEALLRHQADIAVHSMKDVPMELPRGLHLPVICERVDARDVFISNTCNQFADLPKNAIVGTSSLRRQAQVKALRRDLECHDLRGNIQTRLRKLDQGEFAGIILAAAGLDRLHLNSRISNYFSPQQMLPAAGQGALGIECRRDDAATLEFILPLKNAESYACVLAERVVCRKLQGGCMIPIAAYARLENESLHLNGLVANADGSQIIRALASGAIENYADIGEKVAEQLLAQGAQSILRQFQ